MAVVANLAIAITARTRKFMKGMRTVTRRLDRFAAQQRRLAMATGAITAGVVAYAIKAASDYEEVFSKFQTVFREFAAENEAWALQFGQTVGRSRKDVVAFMSTMQDTFVPLGFARREAARLSREITKLAVDIASFNNVADATALRDLQSAIVGNHETVRKYGIIITEAALKQEALAASIIETKREMTSQEKVLTRLNLIFKGSADAQGDAIRTADSFANTMKRFKATVDDAAVALGEHFLPAATETVKQLEAFVRANAKAAKTIVGLGAAATIGAGSIGVTGWIIKQATVAVKALLTPVGLLAAGFVAVLAACEGFIRGGAKLIDVIRGESSWVKELNRELNVHMGLVEEELDAIDAAVKAHDEMQNAAAETVTAFEEVTEAWREMHKAMRGEKMEAFIEDIIGQTHPERALEAYAREVEQVQERMNQLLEGPWTKAAAGEMRELVAYEKEIRRRYEALADLIEAITGVSPVKDFAVDLTNAVREAQRIADRGFGGAAARGAAPAALTVGSAAEVTARSRMEYAMRGPNWEKDTAANTAETAANTEAMAGTISNLAQVSMEVWKF